MSSSESKNQEEIVRYEIKIDLDIINQIRLAEYGEANMAQMRDNVIGTSKILERHLDNLVKWELINDHKPERNGSPRRISLKVPFNVARSRLERLRRAIDIVNEHFNI